MADVNNFHLLSNEELIAVCQQMPLNDLGNFVQASHQQYNVCQDILERRLVEFKTSCQGMSLAELYNYVREDRYGLACSDLLNRQAQEIYESHPLIREQILKRLQNLSPQRSIDASNVDLQGKGLRIINTPQRTGKAKIPGYPVYTFPDLKLWLEAILIGHLV